MKPNIRFVPFGDSSSAMDLLINSPDLTLREFLAQCPALSTDPVAETLLAAPLKQLAISFAKPTQAAQALYLPPGVRLDTIGAAPTGGASASTALAGQKAETAGTAPPEMPLDPARPQYRGELTEEAAVRLAYHGDIEGIASFLRAGLSVLVACDKLVVGYIMEDIARRAGKHPVVLKVPEEEEGGLMPRGLRQRQLASLKTLIRDLKEGSVLIIPHLDLLGGGADQNLPTEARELIELVYEQPSRLVLAFTDRSLGVPEVLASRFAVRLSIAGVPRTVTLPGKEEVSLGSALVTSTEAARFTNYDPEGLYKNVSGMNPVRLRHAVIYAVKEHAGEPVGVEKLYAAIRAFKAQTSNSFEVPTVKFAQIGGYDDVKDELYRVISLMEGAVAISDEKLRSELIPRGFLLHGPPGTGKTLFAKAVANRLDATIQIVSGPEVTDMYVGESERKIRELFADARRNAPAVLVFDEFDAIATKRSGREDGGSRAGNAIVAQILTEMDGFRPDVPMLVIGTTNRLDIIDDALLRPSRFRAIHIGLPDLLARRAIAKVHAEHFHIEVSDMLLDVIAQSTGGLNGDELRSLFRDAYVGLTLEHKAPDARRFGQLVGQIRRAHQERAAAKSGQSHPAAQAPRRSGGRIRPSETETFFTLPDQMQVSVAASNGGDLA